MTFIKKIYIENFKSFEKISLELSSLNLLVGANASGKSNFISIFKFLRNVSSNGLENAISMEGGVEYLRNFYLGNSKDLVINVEYKPSLSVFVTRGSSKFQQVGSRFFNANYEFQIKFHKRGKGYNIVKDELNITNELAIFDQDDQRIIDKKYGTFTFSVKNDFLYTEHDFPPDPQIDINSITPAASLLGRKEKFPKRKLLLESPYFSLAHTFDDPFEEISIFDIDPKLPKKAVSITGKQDLEEDGSNLSIVLNNILRTSENKRKFINLVSDLLPFINDVSVQKIADKSLLFSLKERYFDISLKSLPATFISDGSINLIALIVVLYFQDKTLTVLEEPERNIHPKLISKIVQMCKEVSEDKQLILTTHNPEFVKYIPIENLVLLKRNKKGFSEIECPSQSKAVETFLHNEIGMDELFVQDLLGDY